MLFDTHAHLAHKLFENKLDGIMNVARSADVKKIISVGCSIDETQESLKISEKYQEVYVSTGLYPKDNKTLKESEDTWEKRLGVIKTLLKKDKVVAVGECGLDYSPTHLDEIERGPDEQQKLFVAQIELAKKANLPVIIHSRNAARDTLKIMEQFIGVKFVWHCFSEDFKVAKDAIKLGAKLSFTGLITYTGKKDLIEALKLIDLENIMIETDAPFLIPASGTTRGEKFSHPSHTATIAHKIAEIKNIDPDEVKRITYQNAIKFFNIKE